MKPLHTVTGPAIPLRRANVDTDVIIRIERLTDVARDALGPFAFEALRRQPDGTTDPASVFDNPARAGAPILIAGANFGCGSSREGAVWAIAALGIRCIIAPSFGGIFATNAFQNGVLTITLDPRTVGALLDCAEADAAAPFSVDLERCTIRPPNGAAIPFEIARLRQQALLEGRDEIEMTMKHADAIAAFRARDAEERPWIYDLPSRSAE